MEDVRKPILGPSFHGESWYRCPKCDKAFEFWETRHSKDFKHIDGYLYRHECGQILDMK